MLQRLTDTVIQRLRKELPEGLYYHSPDHTLDVMHAALELAGEEKLPDEETRLLQLAALFHDSGFLVEYNNHEEHSCRIAIEYLTNEGIGSDGIKAVCRMIRATRIPQMPLDFPSMILCDADLDYLGRDDFRKISDLLYRELQHHHKLRSVEEWDRMQEQFFESHTYFTASARSKRAFAKSRHLEEIRMRLSAADL